MYALHSAVEQNLRPLHVRIEDSVGLGGAKLPLSTVVISNVAAEHLRLAAEVTLGQWNSPFARQHKSSARAAG
jgi:hypothetical protein